MCAKQTLALRQEADPGLPLRQPCIEVRCANRRRKSSVAKDRQWCLFSQNNGPIALNRITELQNEEPQLVLLRARKQTLHEASSLLLLQFCLTVIVPAAAAVCGFLYPSVRPYTAALALALTLLDVTFLDRLQRRKIKLSAKIAEAFDETVLQLPWNRFAAGKRAEHADIDAASVAWAKRKINDDEIINWYPVLVARAPLHLGRIIC